MLRFARVHAVVGLVLVASLLAGGCQSASTKQKNAATVAMRDFRGSLDTLDNRIDASVRAIERLRTAGTFDMQAAYRDFQAEYMNVSADSRAVAETAEGMRDEGVNYFVIARKEAISDKDPVKAEEIRVREANTKKDYDVLQTSLGELQETYRTYLHQLGEINKYLARGASRERVTMTYPQLATARDQAQRVKDAIGDVKTKAGALAETAQMK
jgi:hypothetical protein